MIKLENLKKTYESKKELSDILAATSPEKLEKILKEQKKKSPAVEIK